MGNVPFFVSKKYQSFDENLISRFTFFERYKSLNFHQIFSHNDLSIEMGLGSFHPHLICQ